MLLLCHTSKKWRSWDLSFMATGTVSCRERSHFCHKQHPSGTTHSSPPKSAQNPQETSSERQEIGSNKKGCEIQTSSVGPKSHFKNMSCASGTLCSLLICPFDHNLHPNFRNFLFSEIQTQFRWSDQGIRSANPCVSLSELHRDYNLR